jgi:hypothetical protein
VNVATFHQGSRLVTQSRLVAFGLGFIIFLWIGWLLFVGFRPIGSDMKGVVELAESFGIVNSLISGLGLLGLLYTLRLQQAANQEQLTSRQRADFEAGFLNLLETVRLNRAEVRTINLRRRLNADLPEFFRTTFLERIKVAADIDPNEEGNLRANHLGLVWPTMHQTMMDDPRFVEFGVLFSSIELTLNHIKDSKQSLEDKKRYTWVLRAQLNSTLTVLYLLWCIPKPENLAPDRRPLDNVEVLEFGLQAHRGEVRDLAALHFAFLKIG